MSGRRPSYPGILNQLEVQGRLFDTYTEMNSREIQPLAVEPGSKQSVLFNDQLRAVAYGFDLSEANLARH